MQCQCSAGKRKSQAFLYKAPLLDAFLCSHHPDDFCSGFVTDLTVEIQTIAFWWDTSGAFMMGKCLESVGFHFFHFRFETLCKLGRSQSWVEL